MALTPNLSTVTVSGTYVDIQGNPIAGQVSFTPRAILTDPAYDQIIIAKTIYVTLDSNGSFSVVLPVTDDQDLDPYDFTYSVEEAFSGGRTYDISIPSSPSTLDLADVVPALADDGTTVNYVLLSVYTALDAQVQGMVPTVNTAIAPVAQLDAATALAAAAAASAADAANAAVNAAGYIHPFLLMGV